LKGVVTHSSITRAVLLFIHLSDCIFNV